MLPLSLLQVVGKIKKGKLKTMHQILMQLSLELQVFLFLLLHYEMKRSAKETEENEKSMLKVSCFTANKAN